MWHFHSTWYVGLRDNLNITCHRIPISTIISNVATSRKMATKTARSIVNVTACFPALATDTSLHFPPFLHSMQMVGKLLKPGLLTEPAVFVREVARQHDVSLWRHADMATVDWRIIIKLKKLKKTHLPLLPSSLKKAMLFLKQIAVSGEEILVVNYVMHGIFNRHERTQTQQLRDEQDEAYYESVRADQEKVSLLWLNLYLFFFNSLESFVLLVWLLQIANC